MNRQDIILTIKNKSDLQKINDNIKYLNIDIINIDNDVIDFLKIHGKKFLYSEFIDSKNGFIYVDYNSFFHGEKIIEDIINLMPNNLNDLEIARYLYIAIGKILSYDINTNITKNDSYNLNYISKINNIWGALSNNKATNISYCKLYLYLCSLFNIECEIVSTNKEGYLCNKIKIDNNNIFLDLTKDVPFIEANFKTKYFGNYNDDKEIDKKIGYIKKNYVDDIFNKNINKIKNNKDNYVIDFLNYSNEIIDISVLKPLEFEIIYKYLFDKYCKELDITFNNLYLNKNMNNREHFLLINYNNIHYCYNYCKKMFIKISEEYLISNIENNNIGIYLNEDVTFLNSKYASL